MLEVEPASRKAISEQSLNWGYVLWVRDGVSPVRRSHRSEILSEDYLVIEIPNLLTQKCHRPYGAVTFVWSVTGTAGHPNYHPPTLLGCTGHIGERSGGYTARGRAEIWDEALGDPAGSPYIAAF